MSKFDQQIINICEHLQQKQIFDFVGLAIYNQQGKELRWHYALGNRNNKYKKIRVRYGKGIVGQVVRSGSPMILSSFPDQITGIPLEYPIMLAEKLISAMAVPIYRRDAQWGVLLGGNRTPKKYTESEQAHFNHTVSGIQVLLESTPHTNVESPPSTCYNPK